MTKSVRQIAGNIELATTYVDRKLCCFAERNDSRIKTVHQCTERKQIKRSLFGISKPRFTILILLNFDAMDNQSIYCDSIALSDRPTILTLLGTNKHRLYVPLEQVCRHILCDDLLVRLKCI